jgi:hypothetical protein
MIFENDYFQKINFTKRQIDQYYSSAKRDLEIAASSGVEEVIFRFCYDALIKLGITLIAVNGYKIRSMPGHHMKIIEKLAEILADEDVAAVGNTMRQMRNLNLYDGSYAASEKESKEYLEFVQDVFRRAKIVR